MKATYGEVEMTEKKDEVIRKWKEFREIWKDPITDDGTKKSAKGLIAVYHDKDWDRYFMKDQATWEQVNSCALKPVFTDGKLLVDQSLAEIRARIANQ